MSGAGQPLWQMLLPLLVIAVVLALRFKSITKPRPLKPGRLWIQPMILIGLAAMTIGLHPPGLLGTGLSILAALLGGAIGWHRGKLMRIEHDPDYVAKPLRNRCVRIRGMITGRKSLTIHRTPL